MSLPKRIRLTEVGPRDGLQNEREVVPVEAKVAFIDHLSQSGVAEIEVSSFVSPKWVPQLSDAEEVFAAMERRPDVVYSALVPNERGLERALEAHAQGKLDKIAVFTAASETFSRRNTNASIDETLVRLAPVITRALAADIPVRAYISCVVACPYEGPIEAEVVAELAQRLADLGADEIDLGETIGVAVPTDIERLYDAFDDGIEPSQTSLHLHDTRGTALTCAYRAMQLGVERFDASCGGLGGCPYAPGAAGNLATEDLVYLCRQMTIETGVSLDALFSASRAIAEALGRLDGDTRPRVLRGRVFSADGRVERGEPRDADAGQLP